MAMEHPQGVRQLAALVSRIPKGRCASYGDLGSVLDNPVSGVIVGRWMGLIKGDVPWWRVLGKDGRLPLAKRSPEMADHQRHLLAQEGAEWQDGAIVPKHFLTVFELEILAKQLEFWPDALAEAESIQ